ncbi:hypothetical protein D9M71_229830 [compost metagenome]
MEILLGVEKGQWRKRLIHGQYRPRMPFEPALLLCGQDQLLIDDRIWSARSPATLNGLPGLRGNALQDLVENVQQVRVGCTQRKTEARAIEFREVQHLQIHQITLADQVLGTEGVTNVEIDLAKRDRLQRSTKGVEMHDLRLRVMTGYLPSGEIVPDNRYALAG